MSKYINGYRVIKELDIEGFELVKLAKEGKLQPFSKNGRRICDIRIKEKIEKQDNCVLYLKRLELGSYMTGPVYNNRGVNPNSRAAVEKVRLEYEIKALEKKGAVPLSFDQALPEEYRNCLWERFELPASEQMAAKIIERFKSFLYLRAEVDELKEDQPVSKEIKTEEGFQFQGKPRPVDLSTAGEDKEDSIEDNVKKIQLRYENDEQFRIKFPGKSFKPCTYDHLGCRDENTAQFELLLKTIRDGFIHLPIVIDRKNFKRGCEKLLNFIRKQYFPSLPEDFKIWEKDGNNNFRLIFSGYMDDVFDPKKKFEKMSEDSLLKTLEDLVARRNRIVRNQNI
jgi:hypothetical protein